MYLAGDKSLELLIMLQTAQSDISVVFSLVLAQNIYVLSFNIIKVHFARSTSAVCLAHSTRQ